MVKYGKVIVNNNNFLFIALYTKCSISLYNNVKSNRKVCKENRNITKCG